MHLLKKTTKNLKSNIHLAPIGEWRRIDNSIETAIFAAWAYEWFADTGMWEYKVEDHKIYGRRLK